MAASAAHKREPQDLDAELGLIGAILGNGEIFDIVFGLVSSEAFYKKPHIRIYRAMETLHDRGEPIDPITVNAELERLGDSGTTTVAALEALVLNDVSLDQAQAYATIITSAYNRKRILTAARNIATACYDDTVADIDAYVKAQQLLGQAEPLGRPLDYVGGEQLVEETLRSLALAELEKQSRQSREYVATWPWNNLRAYVPFWRPGQPVFVIAESGVGKTKFLMEIARHNATNGGNIIYVHTEDEARILLMRQLASITGVPFSDIEASDYDEANYSEMMDVEIAGVKVRVPSQLLRGIQSMEKAWRGNLWFVNGAGQGISEILFEVQRMSSRFVKPDALVFDWFGDHDWTQSDGTSETMKMIHGIQTLKTWAARSKTRLIVATQTGKAGAQKSRLTAYDAFMTSAVAHYGKTIFTLSRKKVEGVDGNQTSEFAPTMDVSIAKANLDRVGDVRLGVSGASMRLYDLGMMVERGMID